MGRWGQAEARCEDLHLHRQCSKDWKKKQSKKMHRIAKNTFTCCREVSFPGSARLGKAMFAYRKGERPLDLWQWWSKICGFKTLPGAELMVQKITQGKVCDCGSWRRLSWAEMRWWEKERMGTRGEGSNSRDCWQDQCAVDRNILSTQTLMFSLFPLHLISRPVSIS